MKYILSALTSWNFDSINLLCILLFAVIMYALGSLKRRKLSVVISIITVLAVMYLFAQYDWA